MTDSDAHSSGENSFPREFFTETLPRITDLGELKVTLHVMHIARERQVPAVPLSALLDPTVLHSVLGKNSPSPAPSRMKKVLERAVSNGVLLRLTVGHGSSSRQYFLPGTTQGRETVSRLLQDDSELADALHYAAEEPISTYRVNAFALFERDIGPLTPLVSEALREAERSYPRAWIEAAIDEAVHYNKRNWRYIDSILRRWEENGGP